MRRIAAISHIPASLADKHSRSEFQVAACPEIQSINQLNSGLSQVRRIRRSDICNNVSKIEDALLSITTNWNIDTLARIDVARWRGGIEEFRCDDVAEEVPVAMEYNGISYAVMLASPSDLDDFALGFSLTEGIILSRSELYDCDVEATTAGIRVAMRIPGVRFAQLKERRRTMAGRTGCGLCGTESLDQAIRPSPIVSSTATIAAVDLQEGMEQMARLQRLQLRTGATHAAAWLDPGSMTQHVREDVGRHNALDKLIGAITEHRDDFSVGTALITSRASYEMVHKAAMMGIGILAAVSAPTALAVRLAKASKITLIGFAREDRYVVYSGPERLIQ